MCSYSSGLVYTVTYLIRNFKQWRQQWQWECHKTKGLMRINNLSALSCVLHSGTILSRPVQSSNMKWPNTTIIFLFFFLNLNICRPYQFSSRIVGQHFTIWRSWNNRDVVEVAGSYIFIILLHELLVKAAKWLLWPLHYKWCCYKSEQLANEPCFLSPLKSFLFIFL